MSEFGGHAIVVGSRRGDATRVTQLHCYELGYR